MRAGSLFTLLLTLAAVIAAGTVVFRYVEGWSWVDSYFFTVVTLSTVGYGSLVPQTVLGKIATTVFIFVGLGIFAVAIQRIGSYALDMRHRNAEWLVARLDHHDHHARRDGKQHPAEDEHDTANLSSAPPADSPARGPDAPPPRAPDKED
ncbi:ion channel [Rhodosalinus sp. K401]|uniref:ion channel n=1 Tax=Rhodosalinus sp. K401 TaxID=3239195 RepID=UPI003523F65F